MNRLWIILIAAICLASLNRAGVSQTVEQLQSLRVPGDIALSPDGTELFYRLGANSWQISTQPGVEPRQTQIPRPKTTADPTTVEGIPQASSVMRSPDGKKLSYLAAEKPWGASELFCRCGGVHGSPLKLSPLPVRAYQWADDSSSFWVLLNDGTDVVFGRLRQSGHFEPMSRGAAVRGLDGLVSAGGVVAWVQSDPAHHGTIWIKDKTDKIYQLWDPNPQTVAWSKYWTQEVVRWRNAHGEELVGVLARPAGHKRVPLIVDPYSGRQNRFLNIGVLGNYAFVEAGFAVFLPDHRASFAFPEATFGNAYVGASKHRDPVDVLTDDVMSGVQALLRRGDINASEMFLYSTSTGASAIDQLLTQTKAFRAAVSFAGISDWLGYYRANQLIGDETIPNFLRGKRPQDSPALYNRISPIQHVASIHTPLLLAIGDKDSIPGGGSRYLDTLAFYHALKKLNRPVELVVYKDQGHTLSDADLVEQHVSRAIAFFRSQMAVRDR
jgi:dipeptidyl aminopeptidase/acylaminoacyl peptidase